jgi:hormone-sensitive lipase
MIPATLIEDDRASLSGQLQYEDLKQTVEEKLAHFMKAIEKFQLRHSEIMQPMNDQEDITKLFIRLSNCQTILQSHFNFVSDMLKSKSEEEIVELKKIYEPIAGLYVKITRSSDITLVSINESLDTVIKELFTDLEKITDNFFAIKNGKKEVNKDVENLSHVQIVASKLETAIEYFPIVSSLDKDDLFAQPKSSDVWKALYVDAQFKEIGDKEAVQGSIKKINMLLTLANAVLYKSQKQQEKTDNKAWNNIVTAVSSVYYSTQADKAETRASLYLSEPNMDSAFKIWNLPDKKFVKELIKLRLPSIGYDNKLYLAKVFPKITKETVLKEYQEGTVQNFRTNTFNHPDLTEYKEDILKNITTKNKDRVKVRVIAPFPLVLTGQTKEKFKAKMAEMKAKVSEMTINIKDLTNKLFHKEESPKVPVIKDDFNGVIIHIHGGGFVSMSSASHRNYLYLWAKALNMIIFSIDYRLAPQDPFPAAIDDIWQAYNWIVNYSEPILGIPLDKIVLAGDSAGGNFVMTLALRTIREGIRVPDGCLMSYPALNLYPEKFVPTYFVAIDDVILPYNVLKLCLKAYIPEEFNPECDPFLSPIMASDELLSKMPPIRIISGTNDPLHDDIWKLLQRLQKLRKNVQYTIYEGLPHGFLTLDEIIGYDKIIDESVTRLRELFNSS